MGPVHFISDRIVVFENFYDHIDQIFDLAINCPKQPYQIDHLEAYESSIAFSGGNFLSEVAKALKAKRVVDKVSEKANFGVFRYLLAGQFPERIGVHVDQQPWTLITYISASKEMPGTGFYRHRDTGVEDLADLSESERKDFRENILPRDKYDGEAWETIRTIPFSQNTAIAFEAGSLLHSCAVTWGESIQDARITHNFNFDLEY